MTTKLEEYLSQRNGEAWLAAVAELLPEIHEVDQNAVQIWFRFYPVELARYIAAADDREEAIAGLALMGEFDLGAHIDTSHDFLYGHRYWSGVKCIIGKQAESFKRADASLSEVIKDVAVAVAEKLKVERPLVNAIVAVGLGTLDQVGLEKFTATTGESAKPTGLMAKPPAAIIAERAKDDSQGMFGFLKTINKKFSVKYIDARSSGKFEIVQDQEISGASAMYQAQDWKALDERCWEGVVPVECTSASCGTCWIGVIGGKDKLTEVARRERRAMKVFGYNQPDEPKPFLRLACQAKAEGNVTIVIPPWNAVFGKKVYGNVEDVELEPNTTSAKRLRETLASVTPGE